MGPSIYGLDKEKAETLCKIHAQVGVKQFTIDDVRGVDFRHFNKLCAWGFLKKVKRNHKISQEDGSVSKTLTIWIVTDPGKRGVEKLLKEECSC